MNYLRLRPLIAVTALCLAGAACSSSSPSPACSYGGKSYAAGQSFPSTDGRNSCSCSANGGVACTERACLPDGSTTDGQVDKASPDAAPDTVQPQDVAAPDRQEASDTTAGCTLADSYSFGWNGGLVAFSDESTLTPPDKYDHVRTYSRSDGGTKSCSITGLSCLGMNSFGIFDIQQTLQKPDVVSAFNEPAPLLYGTDPRPVDGAVYSVRRSDGHGMLVGGDCAAGASGCRPITEGIAVLVSILKNFDQHMLARSECSGL
ncbi:MAG TPA: hypothetical protein VNO55_07870 [Polyangia bacterium]|nr:hypothetical protein [Polyangia bacterium]